MMSEQLNGFDGDLDAGELSPGTAVRAKSQQTIKQDGPQVIAAGQGNTVVLPANQSIDTLELDGRDLVIVLSDGSRIVVPDGAIVVPQLVVDGTPIPPANVAALLVGNEPEPAAGPTPSSGGNFATDPGAIQAAFDLGDLLPYTELPQGIETVEEIIPGLFDAEPGVVIETPDNPIGVSDAIATVSEKGLPARNGEPEGSDADGDSETTSGTIVFSAQDGLSAILINGVEVTSVGQTFTSPIGILTITSIDLAAGEIGFSYTLQDNTFSEMFDGFFEATVIDNDGDEATASLQIRVMDDAPIGVDDANTVPGGQYGPITGNVLANDISGADGFPTGGGVTGLANDLGSVEPAGTLSGAYGTLTLNEDGSYSYIRDVNTPGGVEDSFTYDIVDQDGSTSSAVLTITIEDSPAEFTFVPDTGVGTVVAEAGLPPRADGHVGTGEIADNDPGNNSDTSETTGATVTFHSPDGLADVSVNGVSVDRGNLPQVVASDATGTLVIIAVTYDPATGQGTITYEYTLGDNTAGNDTSVSFDISITDLDGDTASDTLTIAIVDDEPTAVDDFGVAGPGADDPVTVDVLANDIEGADGVDPADVALVDGSLQGAGTIAYNGDGTFTYTPAPGERGQATFDYSITDGDGDVSTATVTITLNGNSTPEISVAGDSTVNEAGLPARGGEPEGSDEPSDSEIAQGDILISTGGDTLLSLQVNGQDVTGGGTVITAKGVLTISVSGGQYNYTYTLTDNTLSQPDSDSFTLVVTDGDGDTADTMLVIAIADDLPAANDDAAALGAGEFGPVVGSVLANDTQGADGAGITAYSGTGSSGGAGDMVQGMYGKLTISADGSFSYTRDAGTPGGVSDTFTYTITDGDGDTASAQLVISIGNAPTDLDLPVKGEDGAIVDEAGVESPFPGSAAAGDSEITSGTFTYTAPDGPAVVTVDGMVVTAAGQVFAGSYGTLTITSIANGVIGYTYELTTNTSGDNTSDSFAIVVTDQDGDFSSGTLEIAIVDDEPAANADVDFVTEDGPLSATGNVITGADPAPGDSNASDGVADVQGADGAQVSGVAAGLAPGSVAGNVGAAVAGSYGLFTVLANGDYEYVLDNQNASVQGLDSTETLTDTFTYTLTDGDGDTSTTTVTVTINGADDPVVLTGLDATGAEHVVDEDDLPDGSSPDAAALTQTGTFDLASVDGLDTLSIGGTPIFGNGITYPVTINGAYGSLTVTGVATTLDLDGDVVAATISYEYALSDNTEDHQLGGQDQVTDSFAIEARDTDGSVATDVIDIAVIDDVPTAVADSNTVVEGNAVGGNVLTDAADVFGADGAEAAGGVVGVRAAGGDTTSDVVTGVGAVINGLYGTLTLAADGSYTYQSTANAITGDVEDVFVYTIADGDGDLSTTTLTIDVANVALAADNDTQTVYEAALDLNQDGDDLAPGTVTGSNPASTGETVSGQLAVAGTGVTYVLDGGTDSYGTLTLNADGSYTYTLTAPFDTSPDADNGSNIEAGAETYSYTATDADGNTVSGTITIDIVDDVPQVLAPLAAMVTNTAGSISALTTLDTRDGDVDNDYGADGPGAVIFTADSIAALEAQGLTSGFADLTYTISGGGTVLTATKVTDNSEVFRIELQPAGGADQYKVTMAQPLDSTTEVNFNDGTYDFLGGNDPWAGFVPDGQSPHVPGGGSPIADGSSDLLLTPIATRETADSINGTANGAGNGGIGGQNIDPNEGIRLDFVIDLTGNPAGSPANYDGNIAQRDHSFSGHDLVNGALVRFGQGNGDTLVRLTALNVVDGPDNGPAPDPVLRTGTTATVIRIAIEYDGEVETVTYDPGETYPITVTVGSPGGLADRSYTVNFIDDGVGRYVEVEGVLDTNVSIATFADGGYNALTVFNVSGSDFELSGFGSSTISNDPADFSVPISIRDGDGDISDAGVLNVTAKAEAPPVHHDPDGNGGEPSGPETGVPCDMDGDGPQEGDEGGAGEEGGPAPEGNGSEGAGCDADGDGPREGDEGGAGGEGDPAPEGNGSEGAACDADGDGAREGEEGGAGEEGGPAPGAEGNGSEGAACDANGDGPREGDEGGAEEERAPGAEGRGAEGAACGTDGDSPPEGGSDGAVLGFASCARPEVTSGPHADAPFRMGAELRAGELAIGSAALAGYLAGITESAAARAGADYLASEIQSADSVTYRVAPLVENGDRPAAEGHDSSGLPDDGERGYESPFCSHESRGEREEGMTNPLGDGAPLPEGRGAGDNAEEPGIETADIGTGGPENSAAGVMEALLAMAEGGVQVEAGNAGNHDALREAIVDIAADKVVDELVGRFAGDPCEGPVHHEAPPASEVAQALGMVVDGSAMTRMAFVHEVSVDEGTDQALVHG